MRLWLSNSISPRWNASWRCNVLRNERVFLGSVFYFRIHNVTTRNASKLINLTKNPKGNSFQTFFSILSVHYQINSYNRITDNCVIILTRSRIPRVQTYSPSYLTGSNSENALFRSHPCLWLHAGLSRYLAIGSIWRLRISPLFKVQITGIAFTNEKSTPPAPTKQKDRRKNWSRVNTMDKA